MLDVVEAVLGNFTEVDARTEMLWPTIELVDLDTTSVREIRDHVDVIARTTLGASVSTQVLAGVPPADVRFVLEVRGSAGPLTLTGSRAAGVQVGDLVLSSSVPFEPPDSPIAGQRRLSAMA